MSFLISTVAKTPAWFLEGQYNLYPNICQKLDAPGQFSYCQYPFILSIVAKRHILTKDSEQQMILTARR